MRTRTKRRRVSRDADQPILLAALRAERGKEFRASHFKHTGVPKKYVRRALTTDGVTGIEDVTVVRKGHSFWYSCK